MTSIFKIRLNQIFFIVFGISALILILSFTAEYFWELPACLLCKLQRIPYFLLIANSLIGIFSILKTGCLRTIQLLLIGSFFLASFHTLVEYGKVRTSCQRNMQMETLEDFKLILVAEPKCSESSWKLLGLPASLYNATLSLFIVFCICFFQKLNKINNIFKN